MYVAHSVYNEHMAEIQVKGWQCDVCGYLWLRTEVIPTHCPNRECRSRKWNTAALVNGKPAVSKAVTGGSSPPAAAIIYDGIVHDPEYCQDPSCRECRRIRTSQ